VKLREVFLHNIALKLIALLLALLTWSYVGMQVYKETVYSGKESPTVIKVSGGKMIVKNLPIYANIEGNPATGYEVVIDKIAISPLHSVIAGPAELVKDLSYIDTEPVSIEGADSTVRQDVGLVAVPNCEVGYNGSVRVVVPIAKVKHK